MTSNEIQKLVDFCLMEASKSNIKEDRRKHFIDISRCLLKYDILENKNSIGYFTYSNGTTSIHSDKNQNYDITRDKKYYTEDSPKTILCCTKDGIADSMMNHEGTLARN